MKNMKRVLVLMVILCAMMCVTAFAADNTIDTIDQLAEGVTVSGYEDDVNFQLSYNKTTANGMYLVLVLRDELGSGLPTASDILYINQATADSSGVTFDNIYPSEIESDESYIYLSGTGLSGLTKLGRIVPNVTVAENVIVNVIGKGANMPTYTVDGHNVTVSYRLPCKMGYLNAEGTYTAIKATANADGSYSYVVPEDVNEVTVVVKGDVNGDGNVNAGDYGRLNASLLGKTTLTAVSQFASDVNDDARINAGDYGRLNAVLLGKTTLKW